MSLRARLRRRLDEPGEKRDLVHSLFSGIAGRYDLTNDVMSFGLHRRWKGMLLELADLPEGGRVLDVAAGTGDLALEAAERLPDAGGRGGEGRRGSVVAADFARPMLEVGAGRAESQDREEVEWVQADALALPFPARAFDRVVVGYGLRNLADLPRGLSEIRRCLKPGGRLVSLDFAKPRSGLLRRAYLKYLDLMTPAVGWLLHRDPEAYLYIPESLRRFPDQDEMLGLLSRAGFARPGYVDLLFGTMALHFADRPE